MAKKKKFLCPHCGKKIGNDGAMVIHCRTHDFLYECSIGGRTIFEHKSRLVRAVTEAGGMHYLRLFKDIDTAYKYTLTTLKMFPDGELPLLRSALYAYIRNNFHVVKDN